MHHRFLIKIETEEDLLKWKEDRKANYPRISSVPNKILNNKVSHPKSKAKKKFLVTKSKKSQNYKPNQQVIHFTPKISLHQKVGFHLNLKHLSLFVN